MRDIQTRNSGEKTMEKLFRGESPQRYVDEYVELNIMSLLFI